MRPTRDLAPRCWPAARTRRRTTTTTTPTTTTPKAAKLTRNQRLDDMTTSIEKRDFDGALRDTDAWLAEKPDARHAQG